MRRSTRTPAAVPSEQATIRKAVGDIIDLIINHPSERFDNGGFRLEEWNTRITKQEGVVGRAHDFY